MKKTKIPALDIIVEDIGENLWVGALEGRKIAALEIDPEAEIVRWGSIYWARIVRIDTKLNAAFVDLGYGIDAFLPATEVLGAKKTGIGKKLKSGQMVLVQVKTAHQPDGDDRTKLPVVSMDIALQGRFMIYTPLAPVNRVSRRVTDKTLRAHMTAMAKSISSIHGCILRLAAANCQTEVLTREGEILKTIWESLQEYCVDNEPALLMLGPDAMQRVLSDHAARTFGTITIADPNRFEEVDTWCDLYAPELRQRLDEQSVENTRSGMGLFEARDLLGQVEGLLREDVDITGGQLHIEQTAACLTIDVDAKGVEGTLLDTNLAACDEIARQLRLRNIGGIVIVDFAGLLTPEDGKRLYERLNTALAFDPATVHFHGPTKMGLFEMTRSRRTPSLYDRIHLMTLGQK